MKKGLVLYILSAALFFVCLKTGFLFAEHRHLWGDEIYTQTVVSGLTYIKIFKARISEGNVCPLFYLIQRIACDLGQYQIPSQWAQGNWSFRDMYSQILLRINPIFFMSLSITLIFYFFTRYYSIWEGLFSLLIAASSYMVWAYWAEARPYALWVFLTTAQSLIFLSFMNDRSLVKRRWSWLVIVHFLMSVTIVFSLAQIIIVSGLLWVILKNNWRLYLLLTVVPCILCVIYYFLSPKYPFWFTLTPEQLIRECMSRERFYFAFIFIFFLIVYFSAAEK